MATSKFLEVLPLLMDGDKQVGVCAMGPIGDGDKLIWMRAWVWQQDEDAVAASTGNAGDHVPGAHPLKPEQKPPFAAPEERWMVQTGLEPESAKFSHEKPALVQALALVENGGTRNIVQWSQAVGLRMPAPHGPDHEHDHSA
jgi:hypothetical protein